MSMIDAIQNFFKPKMKFQTNTTANSSKSIAEMIEETPYELLNRVEEEWRDYRDIDHQDFQKMLAMCRLHLESINVLRDAKAEIANLRSHIDSAEIEASAIKNEWSIEERSNRMLTTMVTDADEVVEHLSSKLAEHNIAIIEPTILVKARESIMRRANKNVKSKAADVRAATNSFLASDGPAKSVEPANA